MNKAVSTEAIEVMKTTCWSFAKSMRFVLRKNAEKEDVQIGFQRNIKRDKMYPVAVEKKIEKNGQICLF